MRKLSEESRRERERVEHLFGECLERLAVVLLLNVVRNDLCVVAHLLGEIDHVGYVAVAGEDLVHGVLALAQALLHLAAVEELAELVVQAVVLVERLLVHEIRQLTQEDLDYVRYYHRCLCYFLFIRYILVRRL